MPAPLTLSAEDSKAFAEALLDPPEPTEALRRAAERRDELIAPEPETDEG